MPTRDSRDSDGAECKKICFCLFKERRMGPYLSSIFLCLLLSTNVFAQISKDCSRIVSLAPSVTEVLFDLSLDEGLVGVTRYCRFPSAAQKVPHVGGVLDVNLEELVKRHPAVLFTLKESVLSNDVLHQFGIKVWRVDHRTVRGIKDSYRVIGEACGVMEQANVRIAELESIERRVKDSCVARRTRPLRIMFVVGHISGGEGIYLSGRDGFYSDIAQLLGGVNVHSSNTVAIPTLSAEGFLALSPNVIIEVVSPSDSISDDEIRAFWRKLGKASVDQQSKVFIFREDYASIPGPRYVQLLQRLSTILCQ